MALDTSERYTDARRTRVYQGKNRNSNEEFIGQTQAIAPEEKLFDGLSVPQVIAGAAAAATSVALASHIGIAGSVLGAAISSVVTVVSSQIYRRFLTAGARRLKGPTTASDGTTTDYVSDYGYSRRAAQGYYDKAPTRYGARVAPTKLQARAAAERAATQRKVVLFSVAAAVLAVVVCAGAILLSTAGAGLGTRIDTLWPAAEAPISVSSQTESADSADSNATDSSTQATADNASSDASSSQAQSSDNSSTSQSAATGTGAQGTTADSTQSGTDSSNGDSSNSDSSSSTGTGTTTDANTGTNSADSSASGTSATGTSGN